MFSSFLVVLWATFCFGQNLQARDAPPRSPSANIGATDGASTPAALIQDYNILHDYLQAHTPSSQWTHPAKTDLEQNPIPYGKPPKCPIPPTCYAKEIDGIFTQHIKVMEFGNSTDVNITVLIDQVVQPTNSTTHTFDISLTSIRISLGFTEFYTFVMRTTTSGPTHATIHWGPIVHGASLASFHIFNHTITGNLDNRTFNPFPITEAPGNVTFTDGGPSPRLSAPSGLNATLQSFPNLLTRVREALTSCISSVIPPPYGNTTQGLVRRTLDRSQDPGHFSSTYDTGSCNWCKIAATAEGTADGVVCAVGTCWWSFGIGCAVCIAEAAVVTARGILDCESSSSCCPITCGFGSTPTCCLSGETCLNFNTGHCCAGDQQPCEGKECCNTDQSCITQGLMKGTCCPDGPTGSAICGDVCCPHDTDMCVLNAICCAPADVCGERCCNPIDPLSPSVPTFFPKTCADADAELCCYYDQHAVNGVCCYPGEIVVDGICCAPGSVACNGQCCAGACSADGVCQYTITDAQCAAEGYNDGSCGSHLGEWQCQSCYQNGCCVTTPK